MFFLFLLAFLAVLALIFNMGREVFLWLKMLFPHIKLWIYTVVFCAAVLLPLIAFVLSRVPRIGVPRFVLTASHYALGFLLYAVLVINVISLLLFIVKLCRLSAPHLRTVRLAGASLALVLFLGISLYGSLHAAQLKTKRYAVSIEKGQGELCVALISDVHLGYAVGTERLGEIAEAINEAKPDLVCFAGDTFDGDMTALDDPEELKEIFRSIQATYGVYACLGNHDAGESYDEMVEFLTDAGVKVLFDEAVVIDDRFVLAGRRDSSPIGQHGEDRQAFTVGTQALPVIVMDHQPGNIGEYDTATDLILCGHTHKGQMFPFNLITNAIYEVDYGYYRASELSPQVIVSSGAGTWGPPLRVASDCEVVIIDIALGAS